MRPSVGSCQMAFLVCVSVASGQTPTAIADAGEVEEREEQTRSNAFRKAATFS